MNNYINFYNRIGFFILNTSRDANCREVLGRYLLRIEHLGSFSLEV